MRNAVILSLTLLLACLLLAGCAAGTGGETTGQTPDGTEPGTGDSSATPAEEPAQEWQVSLLDGYPEDVVPLYESDLLDTALYSVRNDPQWFAVDGGLRNFHHIVYQTDAQMADVLAYYRGLMDTVDEDFTFGDQIEGVIGKYKVFVNTTDQSSYKAVYVTVDLPKAEVTETNPFYADYPEGLVETPACFTFFEEIYYRTLYRQTDMSYARHFDVLDLDDDEKADLDAEGIYTFYEERYGEKDGFAIDREARTVSWSDGKYAVTLALMSGYDRGVLWIGWDYEPGQ
jgi:hypothetical protein